MFLQTYNAHVLAITDFSLYSIGLILTRLEKDGVFEDFLSDTLEDSGIMKICLVNSDLIHLLSIRQRYQLDFDDAYQYTAAEKHDLAIVSFDNDFDQTELGRLTPGQATA